MNFMLTLLILYKAGYYSEYVSIEIFYKYILVVRKFQINYILEPVRIRSVWV